MRTLRGILLFICVPLTLCTACQRKGPISKTEFLLDTVCTVTLYEPVEPAFLDSCFLRAAELEKQLSRTIPGSDIDRINRSGGKPVAVSQDTLSVLKAGIAYGKQSGGLFDITVAPALDLWDFKAKAPSLPNEKALQKAVQTVDYRSISVQGNSISLPAGMRVDLGALAKGYIADEMAEVLRKAGATSALLDLGGDIVAIGSKPNGTPFRVGIQTPFASQGKTAKTVELTNQAIATSGIYERSFTLNSTVYHHILNPFTGYPVQNELASATIFSDTAMYADALATQSILNGGKTPKGVHQITISHDGTIKDNG